ncbi:helix-turn-helix domain-containing protein [Pedobacter sp. ISL-68]|uniref:AraC family transcriptional regulator n=1 Tax=unclassified Pedobacter TaxID=2628915 RepID=UPI001BEC4D9F|nr:MULTISPECIES: AraC family transcriptional regulator [unclassified Pedobacter]MBT2560269.1 helix-turn-helix domain-containing protein [Pedobacter sp. ISL-64]MBT2589249.1 helix-turn-helix domain-containing protein [Pedobacter sp. ISL-68]
MNTGLNNSLIGIIHDLSDVNKSGTNPVYWNFKTCTVKGYFAGNTLMPNRREFYKIMLITKGSGVMTIGFRTFYIQQPTLIFAHPNDIISWKDLSEQLEAKYILFKKPFLLDNPHFKEMLDKYGLFQNKDKNIISLKDNDLSLVRQYFDNIAEQENAYSCYREETIQVMLQMLIVESMKIGHYPEPNHIGADHLHIHNFFSLLEKETSNINYLAPIRIRTAKEFAQNLDMHPNYLNAVLKKHTGQNVSAHIRDRILEESKTLLLYTSWSLQNISYCLGFAEQPNFTIFFKRNTGVTPASFRRNFIK